MQQNSQKMKISITFLTIICLFLGCKNRSLPSEHLSNIRVVRSMAKEADKPASKQQENTTEKEKNILPEVKDENYHIIVASFKENDKASAEKTVKQLKAENHPASLIYSSQRYRVSIAGFPTEAEATAALDKYRTITKRQDIWVHKVKASEKNTPHRQDTK